MVEPNLKSELAAELERARARIAHNAGLLRHDLDVGTHLKQSFHQNKAAYIGGATFLGLLLSKLPARKKKIYVERKSDKAVRQAEKAGLWLVILQFLFKTFRPMLLSFATRGVTEFVKTRGRHAEE
ncbi:MAG TPA: hypothetical protein VHY22_12255 [Chthoniobacteraceae bacterium]|jgi:hypothetical protein|nr:hypothetical protein [Chthoniobacteraceae bacterium]